MAQSKTTLVKAESYSPFQSLKKSLYTPYCGAADSLSFIVEQISKALYNRNETIPQAKVIEMGVETQNTIRKYYGDLRNGEFQTLMEQGCFGKYGDTYILTTAVISSWITKYVNSEERKLAVKEKMKSDGIAEKPQLSEEEKLLLIDKYTMDLWREYLSLDTEGRRNLFTRDSRIGDSRGAVVFDCIARRDSGISELARQQWDKAMEDRKRAAQLKAEVEKDAKSDVAKKIKEYDANKALGDWTKLLTSKASDYETLVKNVKTRAVEQYFAILAENNVSLVLD